MTKAAANPISRTFTQKREQLVLFHEEVEELLDS